MATLQQQIADTFLKELAESKELDSDKIDALRKALARSEKLKVEELVKILSSPAGGDLQ